MSTGATARRGVPPDAVAAAVIAAGALLLGAVPWLGLLLGWPWLLAVPGTVLVSRAAPGLAPPGRLGAGIAISVALATHLGYPLALFAGAGAHAVALLEAVLALATWVLLTRPLPGLQAPAWPSGRIRLPGEPAGSLSGLWRRHRGAWLCGIAAGGSVGVVLAATAFHHTADGWASGAANWSDLLLHVSIATTIQHGNLPPQVPFFAGTPLVYHWYSDLHGALLGSGSGVGIVGAMTAGSAAMATALGLAAHELGRVLLRSTRAGAVASLLTVFGGGFGWVRLPADLARGGSLTDLLHARQYDFDQVAGSLVHVPPLFEVGLLVQRPMAYGLPLLVVAVLLVAGSPPAGRSGLLLGGCVAAAAVPFQLFTLPLLAVLLPALLLSGIRRRTLAERLRAAALIASPMPYGLAFALPSLRSGGTAHLQLVRGWQEGPVGSSPGRWVLAYGLGLGLPALPAAAALVWRRTPFRLLLLAWVAVPLALVNTVQVTAIAFDSSKLLQLGWPGVALAAAWAVHRLPWAALAPLLVASCLGAVAGAAWAFADTRVALTDAQVDAAHWIEANTPESAVFVTPSFINQPTDLAGRLRLTGFGPYTANYGGDQTARDRAVAAVYCGGDAVAATVMRDEGAEWVLAEGASCADATPTDFAHSAHFRVRFSSAGIAVVQLTG